MRQAKYMTRRKRITPRRLDFTGVPLEWSIHIPGSEIVSEHRQEYIRCNVLPERKRRLELKNIVMPLEEDEDLEPRVHYKKLES